MIDGLKPYPRMKDSGAPWLGAVPEHWSLRKLRQLLTRVTERKRPDLPLLSVVREKGVILRDRGDLDENHNFIPDDLSNYKVVRRGQFALNKMKAWQGSFGVSPHDGIVSPAYFVFDLNGAGPDFFHTAIRSRAYVPAFTAASDGVRVGQWDLSDARLREILFAVPRPDEQLAIVRFLNHADRRIRQYIRVKQNLINLLEEQKHAIIHRAVTRGIDSAARLKPSGIEWLGEVPESWAIVRLKNVARVQTGITLGKDYRGLSVASYPYLRVANVQAGRLELTHVKYVDVPEREATGSMLRDGDVLMTEGGDIDKLGRGCVWRQEIPNCLHQNHIFAVRCDRSRLLPEFLVGLMSSQPGRAYFQSTAKQTTNLAATNSTTLREFQVMLPPVSEQRSITERLSRESAAVSAAIESTNREIALLRESRLRLIADVVTGKLDVRTAASRLHDEQGIEFSQDREETGPAEGAAESDFDSEPEARRHDY